jgi:MFS family permease
MREVYANRGLRRLQLAWAGSIMGTWAFGIALAVYAFEHGGASAVGLVALIRWLPAAFASPFTGVLGDRYPRVAVMITSDLLRALAFAGITACVVLDASAVAVYALVGASSVISTAFRPAQAALLPALARTPEELTAANVSSSTLESLGSCAGPALGGVILALTSTSVVFGLTAAAFLWSTVLLIGLMGTEEPPLTRESHSIAREASQGFRAIVSDHRLQLVVGLFSAQTLVNGAMNVLLALCALELLDMGSGGVGYLSACTGLGGLIGAGFSLLLVGRRRLAGLFGIAVAGTGAPMVFIAPFPSVAVAAVAFGAIGLSNIVEDVAGFTLLQRTTPADVLARVFGIVHSLFFATVAVGAVLAPVLVHAIGLRWTLVAVGAVLPVLSLATRAPLVRLDDSAVDYSRQLELLQAVPMFAPLSPPVLEGLAARLTPVHATAGEEIVRKGDHGDRFYVVDSGEIEVVLDGRAPHREGSSSYFGEIALLHDVPRTATVRAATNAELYALDRDDFLPAVTGHSGSAEAAEAVVTSRLGASTV